ncbi:unnamed protein product [Mytilus coruscus]|uniref:Uncharacterized protein n=1 Tax=Mytilus coruscus TaxID=42192 RepID=A0A6J8AVD5_MYTCO|nr:unnamed protein product [Mytilus coruscus]
MSSTKRHLSVPHQSYRNKQKKKLCPGCGESFVPRYFETHKLKNFQENKWLCEKSSKNDSRDTVSAQVLDDLESTDSNEPLGLHRRDGDFTLAEEGGDQPGEDDSPTDDLMTKSTLLFQWLYSRRRRPCGELLLKVVKLSDGSKCLYPFKTYCYKSIEQSLEQLLRVPDFQRKCEKWRERRHETGMMTDVFGGKIWKEFHLSDKNNFLKSEKNYGIMLNLDWFQPYEHVRYFVGVMYAVVLNLPREERFKLKNVILLGIIPDIGGEPPVQSFVAPLVDELKVAWERGFELCSYESPEIKLT